MNLQTIITNKKSSAGGLGLILTGISTLLGAYATDNLSIETVALAITAIVAGYNGLVARDADVSSEQSGVK